MGGGGYDRRNERVDNVKGQSLQVVSFKSSQLLLD
jgi:hypothetical protein